MHTKQHSMLKVSELHGKQDDPTNLPVPLISAICSLMSATVGISDPSYLLKDDTVLVYGEPVLETDVSNNNNNNNNNNSVALVRERTLPTERPQLVGDVSANFAG
jgi:hypothetical protein